MTSAEYEAGRFLHPYVDTSLLRKLSNPPLTPATVDTVNKAIENREIRSTCLVTHVGCTTERGPLPQAADCLVNLESVTTVVVAGIIEGTIHLSARSINPRIHVGTLLEEAFSDVGNTAGHSNMAGAQISLGLFQECTDGEDELTDITSHHVTARRSAGVWSTIARHRRMSCC